MDPTALSLQIEDELRAMGTPERAEGEKAYLKSSLDFLGVTVGQIRPPLPFFGRDEGR
jgi:hypothetical protein